MSCSLYYKPVKTGHYVSGNPLRDIILAEYGQRAMLDSNALPFLKGLRAGGIEEAEVLIKAIGKFDYIEVYTVC